jgi:hypothetical protein
MRVLSLALAVLVLVACGSEGRVSAAADRAQGALRVTAVEAPLPAKAKGHYNIGLTDVACARPRNCVAAGYLASNTVSRGLLFVEEDGRWSVSEPKSEGVSSVSCPALGHCVAVGYEASGSQLKPLVFTQRAQGWKETVPPLPAGTKGGSLDFISCPSVGNCTAAGMQGLLLDERSGKWTPTTAGLPPNGSTTTGGQTPAIQGLSCWASGNCAAVGIYGDKHGSPQGWLLTEAHGAWAQGAEAKLPANASTRGGSYLSPVIEIGPVSCARTGDCTAVGGYVDRHSRQFGMILSEHAGHWGRARQTPLPANAGPNPQRSNAPVSPMGSIACPAAGKCRAVGWYLDKHGIYHGVLLDERQGAWNPSELASPSAAPHTQPGISLDSLACPSAWNCAAVGAYNPSPSRVGPLLVTKRNGRWMKGLGAPPVEGAGRKYSAALSSVSCPSAKTCIAVGNTGTARSSPYSRGLIVTIRRR